MTTNTPPPLFTPTANGQAYDIAPAGVLLILADMVYGPQDDPDWTGRPKAKAMIQSLLVAARAGGYTQADTLHTLLIGGEPSSRVELMARAAYAAAGNDRLAALFDSLREGRQ